MTDKKTNFESGLADGTAMTTSNTAFTGADAASGSSVLTGCTFAAAAAVHGTLGMQCQAASGVAAYYDYSGFASGSISFAFSFVYRQPAAATTICQARSSAGQNGNLTANSSSANIGMQDTGGTGAFNSGTLTAGVKYQVRGQLISAVAGSGTLALQVYKDSDHSLISSNSVTTANTRGGNIINQRIGKVNTSTETGTFLFDDWEALDGSSTPIALVSGNSPPTANAGPDQSGIEPLRTVTLDGSGSADSDGTVASYLWTQTSGPTVTLSSTTAQKPTFPAPLASSDTTYIFSLVVTDNLGSNSSADSVSITVLKSLEYLNVGGSLVPMGLKVAA